MTLDELVTHLEPFGAIVEQIPQLDPGTVPKMVRVSVKYVALGDGQLTLEAMVAGFIIKLMEGSEALADKLHDILPAALEAAAQQRPAL